MSIVLNNSKHILIGGAKGVGKTTLLKSASLHNDFEVIIFSDLLKSYSKKIFKKNFLRLTLKERDSLRKIVASKILENIKPGVYLWEVHFCCYEFNRKRIVVPKNLFMASSQMILVTLDDNQIKERRMEDLKNKKRSIRNKIVKRDSEIELEAAKRISKKYKNPLVYYQNNLQLPDAVKDFSLFLSKNL